MSCAADSVRALRREITASKFTAMLILGGVAAAAKHICGGSAPQVGSVLVLRAQRSAPSSGISRRCVRSSARAKSASPIPTGAVTTRRDVLCTTRCRCSTCRPTMTGRRRVSGKRDQRLGRDLSRARLHYPSKESERRNRAGSRPARRPRNAAKKWQVPETATQKPVFTLWQP